MGGSDRAGKTDSDLAVEPGGTQTLERWVRRRNSAPALSLRAGIVLACAEGKSNTVVAREMRGEQADGGQMAQPVS